MVSEHCALGEWFFGLSDGVWTQSSGLLWMVGWGRRPTTRARYLSFRVVRSAMEAEDADSGSGPEGNRQQQTSAIIGAKSDKQTENDIDTSPSALGERDCSMAGGPTMELTRRQVEGKRSRGDAPVTAMEVDLAAAQAHAQLWSPELKPELEMNPSAKIEGVDDAMSAGVADECNRISGQELNPEEEEMRADLVNAGKQRELAAWAKFDVFSPHEASRVQKQIVETRWFLPEKCWGGEMRRGPFGGQRLRGSGSEGWISGYPWMREPRILTSPRGAP